MAANLFLSFSGQLSGTVAQALFYWIPRVIQSVEPFLSNQSIDAGDVWASELRTELHGSGVGVLCLTPDNLKAPWILFEAGVLSKSLTRSKVIPYLINLDHADIELPLSQFQGVNANKDGTYKLVTSIKTVLAPNLDDERLADAYEKYGTYIRA